jgi:hypothetical protein
LLGTLYIHVYIVYGISLYIMFHTAGMRRYSKLSEGRCSNATRWVSHGIAVSLHISSGIPVHDMCKYPLGAKIRLTLEVLVYCIFQEALVALANVYLTADISLSRGSKLLIHPPALQEVIGTMATLLQVMENEQLALMVGAYTGARPWCRLMQSSAALRTLWKNFVNYDRLTAYFRRLAIRLFREIESPFHFNYRGFITPPPTP